MKYKNSLRGLTLKTAETVKATQELISNKLGIDITEKSRKIEVVNGRKIYFKILNDHTSLSVTGIGRTLSQSHCNVIHALKKFDEDYEMDKNFRELFDYIYNIFINGDITIDDYEAANKKLKEQIKELQQEIQELRNELQKEKANRIQPRNQQAKIYSSSEGISDLIF